LQDFAGDIALIFKAMGGVYIAGGVAAKLGRRIDSAAFRKAFVMHPPHRHLLEAIPTFLITCEEPALYGCAAYAEHAVGEY
jgi:glucokinase